MGLCPVKATLLAVLAGSGGISSEAGIEFPRGGIDLFFDAERLHRTREKVITPYQLGTKNILLYAPAIRKHFTSDRYALDLLAHLDHLRARFGGEWVFLLRLHPKKRDNAVELIQPRTNIVDVFRHIDMQELLTVADCLITDYSSCSFDFMLARCPVFRIARM